MAKVVLPRALTKAFGIESEFATDATTVRALMRELDSQSPGIAARIEGEMSIAIDGEIYTDALLERLSRDAEVHFVPRLRGG